MQATSAAPNPVLPSASSASPVDSQSSDAPAAGADGQEGTPFAAVLEKQMKAPADKPDTSTARNSAEVPTEVETAVDAVSILASMLAGVTVPVQTTSDTPAASAGVQATAAEESKVEADATAILATALPIAIPVAVPGGTSVASDGGNTAASGSGAAQSFTLAADTDASAAGPAIVAADPALGKEASAENGNNASAQDNKFAVMLDAARAGGDNPSGTSSANVAALATSTHVAPAPHASSASATQVPVTTPVGAEGWSHEVGEKLTWMVGRQENRAELVLNPPQLGRIEVSISMNGDQANASFVSANPAVRDALEDAMPHLREVLQGAGISLGQTQVGAESFQQAYQRENSDNSGRGGNAGNDGAAGAVASGETSAAQWLRRGNGLVDTFA